MVVLNYIPDFVQKKSHCLGNLWFYDTRFWRHIFVSIGENICSNLTEFKQSCRAVDIWNSDVNFLCQQNILKQGENGAVSFLVNEQVTFVMEPEITLFWY